MSNALRKKTRKLEPKNYEDKFTMQRIAKMCIRDSYATG